MSTERQELPEDAQALRALLVRFLIEASPADPRLAQVITSMEQVVRVARDSLEGAWRQDLAAVKADVGSVRQLLESTSQPRIEALLAQGDAQLVAQLKASEERSQALIAKLTTLVGQLTERVMTLETQVRKLSTGG